MQITLISDVHHDIHNLSPSLLKGDIPIIVAGDISNDIMMTIDWLKELKKYRSKIIWVPGNHDFYNLKFGSDRLKSYQWQDAFPKTVDEIQEFYIENSKHIGVDILCKSTTEIEGFKIIGATGWHDFIAGEPYAQKDQIIAWATASNDPYIRWSHFNGPPDYQAVLDEAERDANFIETEVRQSELPVIIVTHHIPHRTLSYPKPHDITWTQLHGMFVNTKLEKIVDEKIKYWFFGHTHFRMMREINGVIYVSNPRGYPYENRNWEPIDIEI